MNTDIYEILSHSNVPRSLQELAAVSDMEPSDLEATLSTLEADAKIARTKKGKYATIEKLGLISGQVFLQHNGTPCIRSDEGASLRIEEGQQSRVLPGDLIVARKIDDRSCALESICRRGMHTIPAYVRIEQNRKSRRFADEFSGMRASAIPCDPRIRHKIRLEGDLSIVRNNEIALLEIDEYPTARRDMYAHVIRILGRSGSMLARMRATAETYAFPTEFSEAAEYEAQLLPRAPFPVPDETRLDLRDCTLFTIDGATAKDFDDAVSIEAHDDGSWRLGVHIADVSYYVRPGSQIDREARSRGTSLYLPGYTVPMLPEILSNDLCSLMPHVDRLAMSLFIDMDDTGKVLDHQLSRSIIHSSARLTYAEVNRLFEGQDCEIAPEVAQSLAHMRKLYGILNARRIKRGTLDFDLPEADFVLNEKYEPVEILTPTRGEAERMIEEFMLKANEVVARLARDTLTPLMYRIHEKPDAERIHELGEFLNIAAKPVHLGPQPHPGKLQAVLADNADNPVIDIIRKYMLRALKKAKYSENPAGHYALALEDYCHFTSPIRRYPDLIVHRMLKFLLDGDLEQRETWVKRMGELANDCSLREQAAVKAERDANDIMKAAYMSHQIGRKFYGVISGVTSWGLYVTLPNTVEGLVHIAELDDYYDYDAKRQTLIGVTTGYILKLGGQVRVRVDRVDVERGEINFELMGFAEA